MDSSHCKNFVDNIQTAFGTKMPPKSMLLQADTGRSGGDLSAGKAALGYPQARWVLKTDPGWSMQCWCVCVFRQQSSSFNTR